MIKRWILSRIFQTVLAIIIILLSHKTSLNAQNNSKPSLIRFIEHKDSAIHIPLTEFCFIEHCTVQEGLSGWFMSGDLTPSTTNNFLILEMNSSEVDGFMSNWDVSGSVQLVLKVPDFKDTVQLNLQGKNQHWLRDINNYGGFASGQTPPEGSIIITRTLTGLQISGRLDLITKKPKTKQQILLRNDFLPAYTIAAFTVKKKKAEAKQDSFKKEFVDAMVDAVIKRDSISKLVADTMKVIPYEGPFRFWISNVDKAGNERTTYVITADSVIVKKGPYDFMYFSKNNPSDKVVNRAASKGKEGYLRMGERLKSDSIHSSYDNMCIIDGLILYFRFEWKGKTKIVSVSNYYLDKLVPVIDYVNRNVPKELKIAYPKDWLLKSQKGCETVLIGD